MTDLEGLIDALADKVAERVQARMNKGGGVVRPRLLNVDQAALYLGRTEDSIRHMQKSGKLPVVKPDGRVQFDVHDLDRWIDTNKTD